MRPVENTYEYEGQYLTVRQLSIISGINGTTIRARLTRKGLSAAEAISTPARGYKEKRKTGRVIKLRRKRVLNIRRKSKHKRIGKLIEVYHEVMATYFTKEHRRRCYQQLIKDYKENRMRIAA